jgi:hypothetical protein
MPLALPGACLVNNHQGAESKMWTTWNAECENLNVRVFPTFSLGLCDVVGIISGGDGLLGE